MREVRKTKKQRKKSLRVLVTSLAQCPPCLNMNLLLACVHYYTLKYEHY